MSSGILIEKMHQLKPVSLGGGWQKVDGKWKSSPNKCDKSLPKGRVNTERNLDIEEMLLKYSARMESGPNKKKKKKKKKSNIMEWVDKSFIKHYNDHDQMKETLSRIEAEHPNIAEVYKLGHSVEGRELLCCRLSGDVRHGRPLLRPMVKYVANIHGDEAVGREMLIGLARYLTDNYATDDRLRQLVDNTDIHLVPSLNPDGDALDTRHNVNDEDLNRGFPGWRDLGQSRAELVRDREKEVKCVINWVMDNPFVLSISFHDGRVMINYPWDDSPEAVEGEKCVCSDDDVFRHLAAEYADNHAFMWTGKCLCHCDTFSSGISNGAEWYLVDNGMQDFNYLFSNCLELTAELSCWKRPPAGHLQVEWENNLDSLLAVLETVHKTCVQGIVTLENTGKPLDKAMVRLDDRDKMMMTTARGEYWRLAVSGTYTITAMHTNKYGTVESEAMEVEVNGDKAVRLDLKCFLRIEDTFLVTGVRKGFCRLLDNSKLEKEVASLFEDAKVLKLELCEEECKNIPDDPVNVQVGFKVSIVMHYNPMASFFAERWNEVEVRRPSTDFDLKKLQRRIVMYSEETWCGRRQYGDWIVRRLHR